MTHVLRGHNHVCREVTVTSRCLYRCVQPSLSSNEIAISLCAPTLHRTISLCAPTLHRTISLCAPTLHRTISLCAPTLHRTISLCAPTHHRTISLCAPTHHRTISFQSDMAKQHSFSKQIQSPPMSNLINVILK